MATPQSSQDSEVLGSILKEFHFELTPVSYGGSYRTGVNPPTKKVGAAGLTSRHPAFGVIGRQIDAAATLVRKIEDFLNRPGTLCIPVHWDIGALQYWPNKDIDRYRSAFGAYLAIDYHTQYSLAIIRTNDKWRVAIYRWTIFGVLRGDRRGRSKPSRKPWLESSYMDKAVTLSGLPNLFEKLLTQIALMVRVASTNEEALTKLSDIVNSLPIE